MSEQSAPPAETRRAIMEATYRAFCADGYADLTMASIAEEFEKSQSLIHYHYDTKEELLTSFLEYLLDEFLTRVEADRDRPPRETLEAVVDALLTGPAAREDYYVAMAELRARSPYNDAYRAQFVENDEHLRALIAGLIERCADAGDDRSVDAEALAYRIMVAIEGARSRQVVLGDEAALDVGRAMIDEQLESVLGAST